MKIVGVNGIGTNGAGNIDLLLRQLRIRRFKTRDVKLPVRHTPSARWGGCVDGQLVAQASIDGDILVAHSFGCLRAWRAHNVRDYRAIICIAPAMEHDVEWRYPERVHCWHSKSDWAVRVGSWLRFHPFGRAGNRGFSQPGVSNIEAYGAGHNDYFQGLRLDALAEFVAKLA